MKTIARFGLLAALILAVGTMTAVAQRGQGGQGGQGGPGGQRQGMGQRGPGGQFDPAQFTEMRLNRLKENIDIADDEWDVISPMIKAVMDAQMDMSRLQMRGFMGGGRGGRGGFGGGEDNTPKEVKELQDSLDNKASADTVKAKLTAYRALRTKLEKAVEDKQADLKKVLTIRQEAALVVNGILD